MNITETRSHNILKGYNMLLYFAGTMLMFDPSNECIYDFWSEGMLKKLPVSSNNPNFIKAASQLRASSEDKNVYAVMKDDFNLLFTSESGALAPPLESAYLHSGSTFNSRTFQKVDEFYRSYGWVSKFHNMIPDDHLGVELLFLTLMIEKLLELDDKACTRAMKQEISRYIEQHISSWVPEWNSRVQEHSQSMSYKGIASLVQGCTEDIYSLMSEKSGS